MLRGEWGSECVLLVEGGAEGEDGGDGRDGGRMAEYGSVSGEMDAFIDIDIDACVRG